VNRLGCKAEKLQACKGADKDIHTDFCISAADVQCGSVLWGNLHGS